MSEKKDVSITKKTTEFFWGAWAMQSSWNFERQMNLGFLFGIAPTLDRLYPEDTPEYVQMKKDAYRREMAFFNCTPQTSAFVLGLAASMEEEYARKRNEFNPEVINALKTSLMGPLSGIGDSFFQGTIRVIAFGLGVSLANQGSVLGPILAMIISFIPSFLITWYGGKFGYLGGNEYLQKLQSGHVMDKVMYICGVVGLMSVGAMVATLIGLTTPITFADKSLVLQDVLDGVLPQMIPLLITGLMYWLMKKQINTGWLLVLSIVGGILLSVSGILV